MKQNKTCKKRGVAVLIVLVLSVALLSFVTILVKNTGSQKTAHTGQYVRARALMAARTAMQLAIYKYRVLMSEFYVVKDKAGIYEAAWMSDFNTSDKASPAFKLRKILNNLRSDDLDYDFGVTEFKIASKGSVNGNIGYSKDYVEITAWGKYGNFEKVIQELIEVKIAP